MPLNTKTLKQVPRGMLTGNVEFRTRFQEQSFPGNNVTVVPSFVRKVSKRAVTRTVLTLRCIYITGVNLIPVNETTRNFAMKFRFSVLHDSYANQNRFPEISFSYVASIAIVLQVRTNRNTVRNLLKLHRPRS